MTQQIHKNREAQELDRLSEPIRDYLKKNCHPHTAIMITEDRVLVVEVAESIPFTN